MESLQSEMETDVVLNDNRNDNDGVNVGQQQAVAVLQELQQPLEPDVVEPEPEQQLFAMNPTAEEVDAMLEEQRAIDNIEEMRRREENRQFVQEHGQGEAGAPMHVMIDDLHDLSISFLGLSPIKGDPSALNDHNYAMMTLVDDYANYSLDDIYHDLKGSSTAVADSTKKCSTSNSSARKPEKKPLPAGLHTKWTRCTAHLPRKSSDKPCDCDLCTGIGQFNEGTGGERKSGSASVDPRNQGRGSKQAPIDRVEARRRKLEAEEVPPDRTELVDAGAKPHCKEGRMFCQCGYCSVRAMLTAAGHADNEYHRTRCTYCRERTKAYIPGLAPIVALFHVYDEPLYAAAEDGQIVIVSLIERLARAIGVRTGVFELAVAYIERDRNVVSGRQVRRFVVAIRNHRVADRLSALQGYENPDLGFNIFPSIETRFEVQDLLQRLGSLNRYLQATEAEFHDAAEEDLEDDSDVELEDNDVDLKDSDYNPEDDEEYEEAEQLEDEEEAARIADEEEPAEEKEAEESGNGDEEVEGSVYSMGNQSEYDGDSGYKIEQFDDSSDDNGHIGGSEHHNSEEHLFGAGEHGGNHGESANGKAVAIQPKAAKRRHESEEEPAVNPAPQDEDDIILVSMVMPSASPTHRHRALKSILKNRPPNPVTIKWPGPDAKKPKVNNWDSIHDMPKPVRKPLGERQENFNIFGSSSTSSASMCGPSTLDASTCQPSTSSASTSNAASVRPKPAMAVNTGGKDAENLPDVDNDSEEIQFLGFH